MTLLEDLLRVGLADGRLAVGEEDDGERPVRCRPAADPGRAAGRRRWRCRRSLPARRPTSSPVHLRRCRPARRPSAYRLTVVAKFITAKRSFGARLSRQNFSAFCACSILTPCMLPEVSRTKTMSRGTSLRSSTAPPRGDTSSMKCRRVTGDRADASARSGRRPCRRACRRAGNPCRATACSLSKVHGRLVVAVPA